MLAKPLSKPFHVSLIKKPVLQFYIVQSWRPNHRHREGTLYTLPLPGNLSGGVGAEGVGPDVLVVSHWSRLGKKGQLFFNFKVMENWGKNNNHAIIFKQNYTKT